MVTGADTQANESEVMMEPARLLDRTDWIKRRNAHGFDWSELVEKMAQVMVEPNEEGLLIDASMIATDEYMPCRFTLCPDDVPGMWVVEEVGEPAALIQHLWSLTMMVTGHRYEPPLLPPEDG